MPTPHTQRPPVPSPRYGPALPPLRPQQSFPQPPPTTDPRELTTTLARNPHLRGVHGQRHMKSTLSALRRCRLHNRLLATRQALHEDHSPNPPAEGQTLSCQHTAFHTGHKDLISDSTISQTLSELIQSRAHTCQNELATPPPRLSTR